MLIAWTKGLGGDEATSRGHRTLCLSASIIDPYLAWQQTFSVDRQNDGHANKSSGSDSRLSPRDRFQIKEKEEKEEWSVLRNSISIKVYPIFIINSSFDKLKPVYRSKVFPSIVFI